tara:strand:- start:1062 stop:2081 length:1020 start_codon:yes stop_codon:yes gene_type:complete
MILVTGGLGYIGSHTVVELLENHYEVLIVDNLSNSSISVLENIKSIISGNVYFEKIDLCNPKDLSLVFQKYTNIKAVIHFAALKSVSESVTKPIDYYKNNISSVLNLIDEINKKSEFCPFIFSSSCTVYGKATKFPITENEPTKPAESPYGNTKKIAEEILNDYALSKKTFDVISLRYFNPIGAHPSLKIGELPINKPENLVPMITKTAIGSNKKLIVYGSDYNTPDGSCVRDYIHITDLAKAHLIALKKLLSKDSSKSHEVYNLGTGNGTSVFELIKLFESISGLKLNYEIGPRRNGDVPISYANPDKAKSGLGWKSNLSIKEALTSAWEWEKKINNK